MNLYRIDMRVYASAYVRADNRDEALAKARATKDMELYLEEDGETVSNLQFTDPDLPALSFGPVCTVVGPDDDDDVELLETGIDENVDAA